MTYYSYLDQPEVVLQDLKPGLNRDRFNFERVIFLDFDGVLHEQGADDADEFCFADNFRDVLVEVDLAGVVPIVVSSTWRHYNPLFVMSGLFTNDIRDRFVGCTGNILGRAPAYQGYRQREIERWMRANAPDGQWLAIDDRKDCFDEECPNLFFVPGAYRNRGEGLTAEVSQQLRIRLDRFLS
jgi:hypothetical protein